MVRDRARWGAVAGEGPGGREGEESGRDGWEEGEGMGEGLAMRHTFNRRVEDAEELGAPRGGPPGWRGVGPLSPAPWTCARLSAAFESTWNRSKQGDSGGQGRGTGVTAQRGEHILLRAASDGGWDREFDFCVILPAGCLQMWPWDPPGRTRTSRTGGPGSKELGHLCYQAHGGTRLGAPATRQLLHVGLARSPLGLRKAPDEDADGERDFLDGFGFTCLLCVDPFDELGIVLELEEIFRGDGRPYPPGEHSLLNCPCWE